MDPSTAPPAPAAPAAVQVEPRVACPPGVVAGPATAPSRSTPARRRYETARSPATPAHSVGRPGFEQRPGLPAAAPSSSWGGTVDVISSILADTPSGGNQC